MNYIKNKELLSIIVANYNNAKYLGACLDSILQQSFDDYIIVVADDASKDDSYLILENYKKQYPEKIKIIKNKKNYGVAKTRNIAIKNTNSKYITTLDADDIYFNPNKLDNELQLLEKNNNDKEIICPFSKIARIDVKSNFLYEYWENKPIAEGNIFKNILLRNSVIPRDYIFTKWIYDKIGGYDETLNIFEDWDLKIRMSKYCKFHCTFEYGTGYRINLSGLSQNTRSYNMNSLIKVFIKNSNLIENSNQNYYKTEIKKHILERMENKLKDDTLKNRILKMVYYAKLLSF